jgi:hypothetical protein
MLRSRASARITVRGVRAHRQIVPVEPLFRAAVHHALLALVVLLVASKVQTSSASIASLHSKVIGQQAAGGDSKGSSRSPASDDNLQQADAPANQDQHNQHHGEHSALGDLGATAVGLLNPRSWDVIAPCVVPDTGPDATGKADADASASRCQHPAGTGSGERVEMCPASLHHSSYLPGAPLGPALEVLRGAASALARRLAALRAAVLGGEDAVARAMHGLAEEVRDPGSWEENPWVRKEVRELLRDEHKEELEELVWHHSPGQGPVGHDQGQQPPPQPHPQAPSRCEDSEEHLRSCPKALRASLAAAAGVDKRMRALVRELRGLVR